MTRITCRLSVFSEERDKVTDSNSRNPRTVSYTHLDVYKRQVQPDTQVDFVASRVFFEAFHQRKNRVAGVGVNFLKHAMYLQVYMGQVLTQ